MDKDCTWEIGSMAALSGDLKILGRGFVWGFNLAVAVANADPEIPCELKIVSKDTRGSWERAGRLGFRLAARRKLIACVCGHVSRDVFEAGLIFDREGILLTGVASHPSTTRMGLDTWFRAASSTTVEAEMAGLHISEGLEAENVVVLDDPDPRNIPNAARWVKEALADEAVELEFPARRRGYPKVASKVAENDPDVVFFDGYLHEAVPFVQDLRDAGFDGIFYGTGAMKDFEYSDAGDAAIDTLLACSCVDAARTPAAQAFSDLHRKRHGIVPRVMAAEVYDVTSFVAEALRGLDGTEPISEVRERVVTFFDEASRVEGIAKSYSWNERGELTGRLDDVVVYEWSDEEITFLPVGTVEELVTDD